MSIGRFRPRIGDFRETQQRHDDSILKEFPWLVTLWNGLAAEATPAESGTGPVGWRQQSPAIAARL